MRVLHITNNYPTNNHPIFGIFVKEQIDSLTSLGIDNDVLFINGREKGIFEYLQSIRKIRNELKAKKYDIIHCHHALSAICLILSGYARKNKVVVSFQNDPLHEQGQQFFKIIKRRANIIILKNNSSLINNKNIFYLPNGVNTELFYPINKKIACDKIHLDPSKKYILFVSSNFVRTQKRYDLFLKTINIIKETYKMENIEEIQLINTERELVPYYFNAASLHLLTSDFEGSPNSVKEAMACDIPVVSTNVGNVAELLNTVKESVTVDSNFPEVIAKSVVSVLNNCGVRNGRKILIEKRLDIKSVAKQLSQIYRNIQE